MAVLIAFSKHIGFFFFFVSIISRALRGDPGDLETSKTNRLLQRLHN